MSLDAGASLCGEEELTPKHQLAEGAAVSPLCCCRNSLCSCCAAGAGLASLRGTETCQQAPRQQGPSSDSLLPSPGKELGSPTRVGMGGKEEVAQHQVLLGAQILPQPCRRNPSRDDNSVSTQDTTLPFRRWWLLEDGRGRE